MVKTKKKIKHYKKISHKRRKKKFPINKVIFAVAVVVVITFLFTTLNNLGENREVVASVNGENIYLDEIMGYYSRLPEAYKQTITIEQILDEVINERLLLQEAVKKGFSVSEEYVETALAELISVDYSSLEDFESFVSSKGLSLEEVRVFLEKQSLITMLLNSEAFQGVDMLNQEEVSNAYKEYTDSLTESANIKKFLEILSNQEFAVINRNLDSFVDCLTDSGMKFYGSKHCTYCKMQKELFGQSFDKINYIECIDEVEICNQEQIRVYPTWEFNGVKQEGIKSLLELSTLTGCEL